MRRRVALLAICLTAAGCLRSAEEAKKRHLQRGEEFRSQAKYRQAILEYRNVLKVDDRRSKELNRAAIAGLARSYFDLGEYGQAFPYLVDACQLRRDDLDLRLKLGMAYLFAFRKSEAQREALFVLERDPENLEALVLLGESATSDEELAEAVHCLEGARVDEDKLPRRDVELGKLYLRQDRLDAAETVFSRALATQPESLDVHLGLGYLYLIRSVVGPAEAEFRAAAEMAPARSSARVKLAEFYLAMDRRSEAQQVLSGITEQAPDFIDAWLHLAAISLDGGDYGEAEHAVSFVVRKDATDPAGLLLQGQIHLARKEPDQALKRFRKLAQLYPMFPPTYYYMARAHLQAGSIALAIADLNETLRLGPDFDEARLLLAELNIQTRSVPQAIQDLEALLKRHGQSTRVHRLLGSAYLAAAKAPKAIDEFHWLALVDPSDSRAHYGLGLALAGSGRTREARAAFAEALRLSPGYLEALDALVVVTLGQGAMEDALALVRAEAERVPGSAQVQLRLARLYRGRKDGALAAAAYRRALELEPGMSEAYRELAWTLVKDGRTKEAAAEVDASLRKTPDRLDFVVLSAYLHETLEEIPEAMAAYEHALKLRPGLHLPANNLAVLLAEKGELRRAMDLAQTARDAAPRNPNVLDTLGWILYKGGEYGAALSSLLESVKGQPDDPEVQYHLGMTYLKLGDRRHAREALARSLGSDAKFKGSDDARQVFAELGPRR